MDTTNNKNNNSQYKNYLLRAMGINNPEKRVSIFEKNDIPGIDPDELKKGTAEEKEEHNMSTKEARKTAIDHLKGKDQEHYYSGLKKAKREGLLKEDSLSLSPTAIPTPVIGVAIRGSNTGGLPSRSDQIGHITPNTLGGYHEVNINPVNSIIVNKTPDNPDIEQEFIPIIDHPALIGGISHPHQIQRDADEPPQSLTGASLENDSTLILKTNVPQDVNFDVSELDETFSRHKDLLKKRLNIKETTCKCKDPNCKCDCKSTGKKECNCDNCKKEKKVKENVGADEPFSTKWKMNQEKAGMVRVSEAFDRMLGLAGIGKKAILTSNGMWKNIIKEDDESESEFNLPDTKHNDPYDSKDHDTRKDKLERVKHMLQKKSRRGTLSNKELKLLQRLNSL